MARRATIVELADIAKRAHVLPRIARSRLRRAKSAPRTVNPARWVFDKADVPKVVSIIKD